MRCLTIRQPWAWAIIHAGKNIENRDWTTKYRGRILVHAAQGCTRSEHGEASDFAYSIGVKEWPLYDGMQRGGIIGTAELVDCVESSESPWFFGRFGFVLASPKSLEFIPCKGALGWWMPSAEVLAEVARQGAA